MTNVPPKNQERGTKKKKTVSFLFFSFQLEDPSELKALKGLQLVDFKLEGNPVVNVLNEKYLK